MMAKQEDTISDTGLVTFGEAVTGKSSVGNAILGQEVFDNKSSTEGITLSAGVVDGRNVTVIDTPGWDSESPPTVPLKILKTACDTASLNGQSIHIVLLVIPIWLNLEWNSKFAQRLLVSLSKFDDNIWRHTMVLFTRANLLDGTGLDGYLQHSGQPMLSLVKKCGHRYHALNNFTQNGSKQVRELHEKIEQMVKDNNGRTLQLSMSAYEEDTMTNCQITNGEQQEMPERYLMLEKQVEEPEREGYIVKSMRDACTSCFFPSEKETDMVHMKEPTCEYIYMQKDGGATPGYCSEPVTFDAAEVNEMSWNNEGALKDNKNQSKPIKIGEHQIQDTHFDQVSEDGGMNDKFERFLHLLRKSNEETPGAKRIADQIVKILRYAWVEHQQEPSKGIKFQLLMWLLMELSNGKLESLTEVLIKPSKKSAEDAEDDGGRPKYNKKSNSGDQDIPQHDKKNDKEMPHQHKRVNIEEIAQHTTVESKEEELKPNRQGESEEICKKNQMRVDEVVSLHSKNKGAEEIPKENIMVADEKVPQCCSTGNQDKTCDDEEIPQQCNAEEIFQSNVMEDEENVPQHSRAGNWEDVPKHNRQGKSEKISQENRIEEDDKIHQCSKTGDSKIPKNKKWDDKEIPKQSTRESAEEILHRNKMGDEYKLLQPSKKDNEGMSQLKQSEDDEKISQYNQKDNADLPMHGESIPNDEEIPHQSESVDVAEILHSNWKGGAEEIPQHSKMGHKEGTLKHNSPGESDEIIKQNRMGDDETLPQQSKKKKKNLHKHGDEKKINFLHRRREHKQSPQLNRDDEKTPRQSKGVDVGQITQRNRHNYEQIQPHSKKGKRIAQLNMHEVVEDKPQRNRCGGGAKTAQNIKRGNQDILHNWKGDSREKLPKKERDNKGVRPQSKKQVNEELPQQNKMGDKEKAPQPNGRGNNKGVMKVPERKVVEVVQKRLHKWSTAFRGTNEKVKKAVQEEAPPRCQHVSEERASSLQNPKGVQSQILPLLGSEVDGARGDQTLIMSRVEFEGSSKLKRSQSMDCVEKLRNAGEEDSGKDWGWWMFRRRRSLHRDLEFHCEN